MPTKKKGDQLSNEMWTDLYKPQTINDLVGNQGSVN